MASGSSFAVLVLVGGVHLRVKGSPAAPELWGEGNGDNTPSLVCCGQWKT